LSHPTLDATLFLPYTLLIFVRQEIPMPTKLTLRLDEDLIRRAKTQAKLRGKSVSEMVGDYFRVLGEAPTDNGEDELTPRVRALMGALAGSDLDEDDYRAWLERKHQ
jgi:hypothetical protein